MANKNFVVQYAIRARDEFSRQARAVKKSFSGIQAEAKKTDKVFNKTSRNFIGGFRDMAAAAAGFFSIREFIDTGSKFESAIADLGAITGSTGKDLQFLTNEALRLGKTSVTAQDQVATAFKIIASAKSELLDDLGGLSSVTEQVLLLANASGMDLTQAANVTTQALNQYGAGADQAARFVNVLAAGSKVGASEVNETGVAIIKAGAVAKKVGVGFEELNSAIQVLAKGGIKAEVAGTGIKTALLRLERQGIAKIKPSVVGLTEAFDNLGQMNLTTTQLQRLFGDEAVVIGSILSDNAKLLGQWTGELTGTNIAQEQADRRLATFTKRMQAMKGVVSDAAIKTFIKLSPILKQTADDFAVFLQSIDASQIDGFVSAIKVMINALKFVGFIAKELLGLFKGIGEVLGQTAAAISTFDFGQFDLENAFRIGASSFMDDKPKTVKTAGGSMQQSTDVNVNVGLDQGLKQTSKAKTTTTSRGGNVGVMPAY